MVQTDKMKYNRHESILWHLDEKISLHLNEKIYILLPKHKVGGNLAYQQFI